MSLYHVMPLIWAEVWKIVLEGATEHMWARLSLQWTLQGCIPFRTYRKVVLLGSAEVLEALDAFWWCGSRIAHSQCSGKGHSRLSIGWRCSEKSVAEDNLWTRKIASLDSTTTVWWRSVVRDAEAAKNRSDRWSCSQSSSIISPILRIPLSWKTVVFYLHIPTYILRNRLDVGNTNMHWSYGEWVLLYFRYTSKLSITIRLLYLFDLSCIWHSKCTVSRFSGPMDPMGSFFKIVSVSETMCFCEWPISSPIHGVAFL